MKKKMINIPFKGFKTHVSIYGDITKNIPIILLHGGPGGTCEKYESLTHLADQGIPMILYDQLGSGYSKVPKNHFELYNFDTFEDEIDNLVMHLNIKEYILLGHSWGGMLALQYFIDREHEGLKKLILFSTLPSTKIWNEEHLNELESFPKEYKEAILNSIYGKPYDKKALKAGIKLFYDNHVGKKSDRKYINKRKRFPKLNKEIYNYMWGPNEFVGLGTLKDYNVEDDLYKIDVPTLILSGELDESTPRMNKLMNERIKNSKWVMFNRCHHASYVEEPELVRKAIFDFYKN